ncbi:MAG: hypothetical protein AB1744_09705, partial [Candidatus Zixiibacteriota bacterium]
MFEAAGDRWAGRRSTTNNCLKIKPLWLTGQYRMTDPTPGPYELGRLSLSAAAKKAYVLPCDDDETFRLFASPSIGDGA